MVRCRLCPLYRFTEEMERYGVACNYSLGRECCVGKLQDLVEKLHQEVKRLETTDKRK